MQLLIISLFPYQDDVSLSTYTVATEAILLTLALRQASSVGAFTIKKYRVRIFPIEEPGDGRLCLEMSFLHSLPETALRKLIREVNGLGLLSFSGLKRGAWIVASTGRI